MVKTLTLSDNVESFLRKHAEKKFIARVIAERIVASYPAEYKRKAEESKQPDINIEQQVAAEIGAQRMQIQNAHPHIKTTETRPRQYYWTEKSDEDEVDEAEGGGDEPTPKESALYQKLSDYLRDEHDLYSKRIDEKRSSKKQGQRGNVWLHPDVVAMEDVTRRWHPKVRECVDACRGEKVRLWSFEVKLKINRANVRDCYMQAVANSAWANFGYIVTADVTESKNQETMDEFRVLHCLHGIGLILLNPENPAEGEIRLYARERQEVDWTTCNRFAQENPDFLDFLVNVTLKQRGFVDRTFWSAMPNEVRN